MSSQHENLGMRIARTQADDYDSMLRKQSDEACDCQDCQAYLKLGIQVFDWIMDVDRNYRKQVFEGGAHDEAIERELERLLRRWHQKCEMAIGWAERHETQGFDVSDLSEFKNRCEEARAMVEYLDGNENDRIMSEPLIVLRDSALEDHRNGQTAEFI